MRELCFLHNLQSEDMQINIVKLLIIPILASSIRSQ